MSPDELLLQLGELATSLGPAVRPAGSDELLRSLTETARQLFGAAACSLALLSEDESELVYTVAAGQGADDVTGMRIPVSQGIAGWVVQSGQPIAVSDVASDPRFAKEQAEQTGYIPQAILAVPVETPARWYVILYPGIGTRTREVFQAAELTRNSPLITIRAFFESGGRNDCEAVVRKHTPEVAEALDWLRRFAPARLTGTGSAVFAACATSAEAEGLAARVPDRWRSFVARGLATSPVHEMLRERRRA